jgi:hypothetical protein
VEEESAVCSKVTLAGYGIGAEPTCDPIRGEEAKERVREEDERTVGRKRKGE